MTAKGTLPNFLHQYIAETLSTHHHYHQIHFPIWRLGPAKKSGNHSLALPWFLPLMPKQKNMLTIIIRQEAKPFTHRFPSSTIQ